MDIEGGEGIRKSELVNWYLEQISDDLEDENELLQQRQIIEKVIYRLTHHVSHSSVDYCIFIRLYGHLSSTVRTLRCLYTISVISQ